MSTLKDNRITIERRNYERRGIASHWISVLDKEFWHVSGEGWHAVDFETLRMAQHDLEHWWEYARRGEDYDPEQHCHCFDDTTDETDEDDFAALDYDELDEDEFA
jgi:hypothetical protein